MGDAHLPHFAPLSPICRFRVRLDLKPFAEDAAMSDKLLSC